MPLISKQSGEYGSRGLNNSRNFSDNDEAQNKTREFNFDNREKGQILGSFYYGYVLSEIMIGWLADKYGGTNTLGITITFSALASSALPFVAEFGAFYIIIFRAVIGIFEGGLYPSVQAVWAKWALPEEKTTLVTISFTGIPIGNFIGFLGFGFLADTFGWRFLFFVPGACGIIWSIVWFLNVKSDPKNDQKLTAYEREKFKFNSPENGRKQKVIYPWKKIFTSVPVWMVVLSHFSIMWVYTTMITYLPTVLNDVWKIDLNRIGIFSSLPHLASVMVQPFVGLVADFLRNKTKLTTTTVRKLCQFIAGFGSAFFIFAAAYSSSPTMAIASFTLMMCCEPFCFASFFPNVIELSPSHSGVIMGISGTIASASGILCCVVASELTTKKTKEEWCMVFSISGIICILGAVFYLLFGSAKLQPWAQSDNQVTNDCNDV